MKIHLEIEATPAALTHAADTLRRMAGGLAAAPVTDDAPTYDRVQELEAIARATGPKRVPDAALRTDHIHGDGTVGAPGAPSDTDIELVGDDAGDPPFPPLDDAAGDPPPPPVKSIVPISPFRVELDSDGLPWDERIHSRGKTLLAKTKQWKRARNLDEETIVAVEAELRVKYPAPAPAAVAPKPAPTPLAAKFPELGATASDLPPPPPSDDTPGDPTVRDFPTLMRLVTAARITQPQLMEACKGVGVVPALLPRRPDLIPAVAEALGLKL